MRGRLGLTLCGGGGSTGTHLLASLLHSIGRLRVGPEIHLTHQRQLYDPDRFRRCLFKSLVGKNERLVVKTSSGARYEILPSRLFDNRDFYGLDVDTLYELFEGSSSFDELIAKLKAHTARLHGWEPEFHWFEHSPRNSICAREFLEAFPEEKFIHLVRDGRDAMVSQAERFQRGGAFPELPRMEALDLAVQLWCLTQSGGLRAVGREGYLRIRYEDLVSRTLDTLNEVLRHIGEPTLQAAELSEQRKEQPDLGFTSQTGWTHDLRGPIDSSGVGRWRRELGGREVAFLEAARPRFQAPDALGFKEIQERLGYSS